MSPEINDLIQHFEKDWKFARGLTLDLLRSLSDEDLVYSPGSNLGPMWKQFRHLGRVQENYSGALVSGKMEFSSQGARYQGSNSQEDLLTYLSHLDRELNERIHGLDGGGFINWSGKPVGIYNHLMRMANHEILHHGEFIVYLSLLGREFPESWSAWGI